MQIMYKRANRKRRSYQGPSRLRGDELLEREYEGPIVPSYSYRVFVLHNVVDKLIDFISQSTDFLLILTN